MNLKKIILFTYILSFYACIDNTAESNYSGSTTNSYFSSNENKNKPTLSVEEYIRYVQNESNGLNVQKEIDGLKYLYQYKPLEYISAVELRKNKISKNELKNKIETIEELQYCNFRIISDEKNEFLRYRIKFPDEYYSRIEYYSFEMQNDIHLIDGSDTLDCLLFHFERVYSIAPYVTFTCGFAKQYNEKSSSSDFNNKTFVYEDKIFNTGKIYLTVEAKALKNLPLLETYN